MENNYYPFYNIPLPFEFDALEPYIDAKTMHLHHDKHLQTYIDNLNNILKSETWLQKMSLEQLIVNSENLPEKLKTPVKNNAGGVYNHRFFFSCLKNPAASQPAGRLGRKINMQFKGFENFKQELKKAALSVFGSGNAILTSCRSNSKTGENLRNKL